MAFRLAMHVNGVQQPFHVSVRVDITIELTHVGSKQISALAFITHPFVRKDIALYAPSGSTEMSLGAGQGEAPTEWGDEDDTKSLPPKELTGRLATVFSWVDELFHALDLESRNTIDLSRSGAAIYKILSDMNLQQLWETMTKTIDHEALITPDQFLLVVLAWTGIDDAFELSHQRPHGHGVSPWLDC